MTRAIDVPVLCLTLEQAAEAAQVGRSTLDAWSHRAGFPVIRDGNVVRVPLDLFKLWLEEMAQTPARVPAVLPLEVVPPRRQR